MADTDTCRCKFFSYKWLQIINRFIWIWQKIATVQYIEDLISVAISWVLWNKPLASFINFKWNDQGPVVQSVVSLTSSLRVISLTVLVDSIYNILIFFAKKMWVAFALQKLLTFFNKKFQHICISLDVNFNESLTNDIVSFEQLGPGI